MCKRPWSQVVRVPHSPNLKCVYMTKSWALKLHQELRNAVQPEAYRPKSGHYDMLEATALWCQPFYSSHEHNLRLTLALAVTRNLEGFEVGHKAVMRRHHLDSSSTICWTKGETASLLCKWVVSLYLCTKLQYFEQCLQNVQKIWKGRGTLVLVLAQAARSCCDSDARPPTHPSKSSCHYKWITISWPLWISLHPPRVDVLQRDSGCDGDYLLKPIFGRLKSRLNKQ